MASQHEMSRFHPLFASVEACKEFLLDEGFVTPTSPCIKCDAQSKLTLYKERDVSRLIYIVAPPRIAELKFPCCLLQPRCLCIIFFHVLYLVVCNASYDLINDLSGCSGSTIA